MGLSGCTTVLPPRIEYPLPPAKLMEPAKELEQVPIGTTDLETVTKIIIRNYSQYQREALKLESLQDWIQTLNQITNRDKE
jgi:hypothetical protein